MLPAHSDEKKQDMEDFLREKVAKSPKQTHLFPSIATNFFFFLIQASSCY